MCTYPPTPHILVLSSRVISRCCPVPSLLPCALFPVYTPIVELHAHRWNGVALRCQSDLLDPRGSPYAHCHISVPIAILCSFASEITHTYIRNGAPRPPFYSAKRSATRRRLSFSAFVSFLRPYPYLCTDGHPLGTFPTKFVRFRVDIFSCCVCVDSMLLTFVV